MEPIGFLILGVILAIVCGAILAAFALRMHLYRHRGRLVLPTPTLNVVRAHSMRTIPPLQSKTIRFGLGSSAAPTFFIWRLWAQGNETYLSFAPKAHPKLSLHSSGRWQIDLGNHRHNLDGPIRVNDDWIAGPVIFFVNLPHSRSTVMTDLSKLASERKKVMWFDMPPVLHIAEFAVFIGNRRSGRSLPPSDDRVFGEQYAIGPLMLRNGGCVWLRYLRKPIPDERIGHLIDLRQKLEVGSSEFHGMLLAFDTGNSIKAIPVSATRDDDDDDGDGDD